MTVEIKLPALGEGVEEADVLDVLVEEGDEIELEQGIIEVETEKASAEIPCTKAGKVEKVHVSAGDTIHVGDVLLTLAEENGEESDDQASSSDADAKEKESGEEEEEEGQNKKAKKQTKKKKKKSSKDAASDEPAEEKAGSEPSEDEEASDSDNEDEPPAKQEDEEEEEEGGGGKRRSRVWREERQIQAGASVRLVRGTPPASPCPRRGQSGSPPLCS